MHITCLCRFTASTARVGHMRAWVTQSPTDTVKLKTVPIPTMTRPDQVLIKVKAASVNPIDAMMVQGYGRQMLGTWKRIANCDSKATRFPFIPGRDCAGVIEAVGGSVKSFKIGDEVMAVIPALYEGCHAEFVITKESCCSPKPPNLEFTEAAGMPYVANTAWAALVTVARMNPRVEPGERVLINGGSGGVGTMAIQLLKAWGVDKVVATCSRKNADMVRKLGAVPVDYEAEDARDRLIDEGPFEVIFDCVDTDLARWSDKLLSSWNNSVHVSVVSPLLRDTDRHGLVMGLASTTVRHFCRAYEGAISGRWFLYAYFMPNKECMQQISHLSRDGKISPVVEQVMSFEELPAAYEKVAALHGHGKTVLNLL